MSLHLISYAGEVRFTSRDGSAYGKLHLDTLLIPCQVTLQNINPFERLVFPVRL